MKAVDYIRKGWTRGEMARNASGRCCEMDSPHAARWCAAGAIFMAYRYKEQNDAIARLKRLLNLDDDYELTSWNDDKRRTKREVIEAMEKAGV